MHGQSAFDHIKEPEVKPTTRLRLEEVGGTSKLVTHLSAMTVQHGDMVALCMLPKRLRWGKIRYGRSDADPDALWAKVKKSKKSIGQIIMDQSFFAGPGNIYRAGLAISTPHLVRGFFRRGRDFRQTNFSRKATYTTDGF